MPPVRGHVVRFAVLRLECPSLVNDALYSVRYQRGSLDRSTPSDICEGGGIVKFTDPKEAETIVHFKAGKFPGVFMPKLVKFQVEEATKHRRVVGEVSVDISKFLAPGQDSIRVVHSAEFRMGGLGAIMQISIAIYPEGSSPPPPNSAPPVASTIITPSASSTSSAGHSAGMHRHSVPSSIGTRYEEPASQFPSRQPSEAVSRDVAMSCLQRFQLMIADQRARSATGERVAAQREHAASLRNQLESLKNRNAQLQRQADSGSSPALAASKHFVELKLSSIPARHFAIETRRDLPAKRREILEELGIEGDVGDVDDGDAGEAVVLKKKIKRLGSRVSALTKEKEKLEAEQETLGRLQEKRDVTADLCANLEKISRIESELEALREEQTQHKSALDRIGKFTKEKNQVDELAREALAIEVEEAKELERRLENMMAAAAVAVLKSKASPSKPATSTIDDLFGGPAPAAAPAAAAPAAPPANSSGQSLFGSSAPAATAAPPANQPTQDLFAAKPTASAPLTSPDLFSATPAGASAPQSSRGSADLFASPPLPQDHGASATPDLFSAGSSTGAAPAISQQSGMSLFDKQPEPDGDIAPRRLSSTMPGMTLPDLGTDAAPPQAAPAATAASNDLFATFGGGPSPSNGHPLHHQDESISSSRASTPPGARTFELHGDAHTHDGQHQHQQGGGSLWGSQGASMPPSLDDLDREQRKRDAAAEAEMRQKEEEWRRDQAGRLSSLVEQEGQARNSVFAEEQHHVEALWRSHVEARQHVTHRVEAQRQQLHSAALAEEERRIEELRAAQRAELARLEELRREREAQNNELMSLRAEAERLRSENRSMSMAGGSMSAAGHHTDPVSVSPLPRIPQSVAPSRSPVMATRLSLPRDDPPQQQQQQQHPAPAQQTQGNDAFSTFDPFGNSSAAKPAAGGAAPKVSGFERTHSGFGGSEFDTFAKAPRSHQGPSLQSTAPASAPQGHAQPSAAASGFDSFDPFNKPKPAAASVAPQHAAPSQAAAPTAKPDLFSAGNNGGGGGGFDSFDPFNKPKPAAAPVPAQPAAPVAPEKPDLFNSGNQGGGGGFDSFDTYGKPSAVPAKPSSTGLPPDFDVPERSESMPTQSHASTEREAEAASMVRPPSLSPNMFGNASYGGFGSPGLGGSSFDPLKDFEPVQLRPKSTTLMDAMVTFQSSDPADDSSYEDEPQLMPIAASPQGQQSAEVPVAAEPSGFTASSAPAAGTARIEENISSSVETTSDDEPDGAGGAGVFPLRESPTSSASPVHIGGLQPSQLLPPAPQAPSAQRDEISGAQPAAASPQQDLFSQFGSKPEAEVATGSSSPQASVSLEPTPPKSGNDEPASKPGADLFSATPEPAAAPPSFDMSPQERATTSEFVANDQPPAAGAVHSNTSTQPSAAASGFDSFDPFNKPKPAAAPVAAAPAAQPDLFNAGNNGGGGFDSFEPFNKPKPAAAPEPAQPPAPAASEKPDLFNTAGNQGGGGGFDSFEPFSKPDVAASEPSTAASQPADLFSAKSTNGQPQGANFGGFEQPKENGNGLAEPQHLAPPQPEVAAAPAVEQKAPQPSEASLIRRRQMLSSIKMDSDSD